MSRAGHGEAMPSGLLRSTVAQLRSSRDDQGFGSGLIESWDQGFVLMDQGFGEA